MWNNLVLRCPPTSKPISAMMRVRLIGGTTGSMCTFRRCESGAILSSKDANWSLALGAPCNLPDKLRRMPRKRRVRLLLQRPDIQRGYPPDRIHRLYRRTYRVEPACGPFRAAESAGSRAQRAGSPGTSLALAATAFGFRAFRRIFEFARQYIPRRSNGC